MKVIKILFILIIISTLFSYSKNMKTQGTKQFNALSMKLSNINSHKSESWGAYKNEQYIEPIGNWIDKGRYFENDVISGTIILLKLTIDSQYFFTYSTDGILRSWDIESGKVSGEKKIVIPNINSFDITKDAKYFIAGIRPDDNNCYFIKYDIDNDKILDTLFSDKNSDHPSYNYRYKIVNQKVIISPFDNKYILSVINNSSSNAPPWTTYINGINNLYEFSSDKLIKKLSNGELISGIYSDDEKFLSYTIKDHSSWWYRNSGGSTTYSNTFLNDSIIKSGVGKILKLGDFTNISNFIPCYTEVTKSYIFLDPFKDTILKQIPISSKSFNDIEYNYPKGHFITNNEKFLVYITNNQLTYNNQSTLINVLHINSGLVIDSIIINGITDTWYLLNVPGSNKFITASNNGKLRLFDFPVFNKNLISIFKSDTSLGLLYDPIHFTDLSDGNIKSRFWDFGDSTYSSQMNPVHKYEQSGIYTVSLIVSDGIKTDTMVRKNYITITSPIKPDFICDQTNGFINMTVQFTDKSVGKIKSRLWNFGDGTSSAEVNPLHKYEKEGNFSVSLIVTDSIYKDAITKWNFIIVNRPPIISLPIHFEKEFIYDESYTWLGNSGLECIDGGYIVVGSASKLIDPNYHVYDNYTLVIRLDNKGDTLWTKKLTTGSGIKQIQDGGFILIGWINKDHSDILVIKLDKNGNKLWEKIYGTAADDDYCSLNPTQDGGFIVNGHSYFQSAKETLVYKCDADGNIQWWKVYPGDGGTVISTSDGGYIIRCISSGNIDLVLIKLDLNGNQLWLKTFGDGIALYSTNIIEVPNGFIVTGYKSIDNNGNCVGYVGKFDKKDGSLIWEYTTKKEWINYLDLTVATNNNIAVTGRLSGNLGLDFISQSGEDLRSYIFDYRKGNFNTIVNTQDSGLFMVGTILHPSGQSKIYSLKINKYDISTNINFEHNNVSQISLFPNPATDYIEISVPADLNQRFKSLVQDIHVYFAFGEEVPIPNCFESVSSSAFQCSLRLDVSGFVPGVYFVKIGDRVSKFVKI